MANPIKIIKNGIINENPTFVQVIGMCPTLAVTSSAINGIGMGLSTTAVLIFANLFISLLRKVIPDTVRIPCFIVVIATFVTIIEFLLKAYLPALNASLGLYIPLIVVNCLILARAEAFASKNGPVASAFDGIGMGLGFTVGLTCIAIVRELIGGVYFGEHRTEEANGEQKATDIMAYSEHEIKRVARVAFETARKRRKRVTSIDKANVLDTSRLWRKTVTEVAKDYPDVELRHMYVDNAAMQLVRDPSQFDVIVTENLFGDILSDEASQITGSIGMIPSSSMGDGTNGLYEPIHGSAPDIAGQDKANPIGTILAAAMMLRYSFDMAAEADAIERAVDETLRSGFRCGDIMQENCQLVGCKAMGAEIRSRI